MTVLIARRSKEELLMVLVYLKREFVLSGKMRPIDLALNCHVANKCKWMCWMVTGKI